MVLRKAMYSFLLGLLLWPASAAASPSANAAVTGLGDAPGGVSPETWMHDLAPRLWSRKLSEIVIPGSHDTATYGLDGTNWDYAGAQHQSEDITAPADLVDEANERDNAAHVGIR